MNQTIEKFGYPATLIAEYEHWVLLLRPAQPTAGSLILAAKSDVTSYGELPRQAFAEQAEVIADLEAMLTRAVNFEKINYLMLMMVDPHVHFHVIPRYADTRSLAGISIADPAWPGPPDLKSATTFDQASIEAAVRSLKGHLPQASVQGG